LCEGLEQGDVGGALGGDEGEEVFGIHRDLFFVFDFSVGFGFLVE